ncbi:Glycosyl hydrolase family 98, carbohydrate binding module (plasmid) [Deinococcus geothermalis DSM 11300]|uniref:Glycosyl hydrolase family 98, carbohydrate binding module n=2 Tax=Deinococcaceae TaxID=183710 RepID=Q1J329_DEIGD|nr:Glycosyl hydrolase family 98, carbohydrate binding module [Deinococcus geothermalis DSM 11300]MBI0446269.1 glycosyl hydrolase [Deinococcus sp. DB0503]
MVQRKPSTSALRLGLACALALGAVACSTPQSHPDANDPVAAYPYLPGVDYSWADVPKTADPYPGGQGYPWHGLALAATSTPTDLGLTTDLKWDSASSGYGPVELNKSNNTKTGGDGQTLTIGGQTYALGLGAHANSDIRYTLPGDCATFTATVGVDDEVGNLGSVVFQVWDGTTTKLYDSGVLRGSDGPKEITVPLTRSDGTAVRNLRLVVTDAGDGISYDHADWAMPKVLSCTVPQASGDKFLSDLPTATPPVNGYGPYELDTSNGERLGGDGRPLTIGGTTYRKGLGVHAASELVYDLGGNCSTFTAEVGVDDEVGDRGSVVFQVFADGTELFNSGVRTGKDPALAVNQSVAGKKQLKLVVSGTADGISYDHADWANAKISCSVIQPTVSSVTVNPATLNMSVNGTQQLTAEVKGSGAFDPGVTWTTSDAKVATVSSSGLVTALAPGSVTVTATSNFDPSKSGSSQITVTSTPTLPDGGVLINFQPASSAAPAGYTKDTGAAYDASRGFGWIREDSVGTGSSVPLDITPNTRDRALVGVDARLNTLIHMQLPASNTTSTGVKIPAAWEYALPNGIYTVTVAVGDASNVYDSAHQINIEGQLAIPRFTPTATKKFVTTTLRANVTDGRLTIDARGGSNTKIDYVTIQPGNRPSARSISPQDGQTMVSTTTPITVDLNLPNSAIDDNTFTPSAVRLIDAGTNVAVSALCETSGGGDVIVCQPNQPLQANTKYIFEITDGVKDTSGAAFLPVRTSFVTGASGSSTGDVAFEQVALSNAPAMSYTSVEIGPDGKLYAATLSGEILRFGILPDGTVTPPEVIKSVQQANGGPRTIIGLKFDPASTADNLVLWISNNAFWDGRTTPPDWSGKITRLSGPNLEKVQDYVVGLPRSNQDHMTNSISFRPGEPNALYVLQGSNSAMGAPDTAWGNRPERLLNAALLRVDLSKITTPPLDVKTAEGGLYNPYAPGAPVTIYASGIRNAYDMVWHTNGQLYVPTNGSAAGGNTPGTPTPLPDSCRTRPDGAYTGPAVPALSSVGVQHDFLFRVTPGGYYGHPNPQRCEWVLNGGNPTANVDPGEVPEYPVGTLPDRNWKGFAYDFGEHASANGVIEEYSSAPITSLKNTLLVVRYSAGKDIIVLTPGGPNQDIVKAQTGIVGLTNFNPSPLDLTEDRTNGHLYVAQLDQRTGAGKLTLLRLK